MKYGIIGKLVKHGEILGYFIDNGNKRLLISRDKLFTLAKNGVIVGWTVVSDGDDEYLYSQDYLLSDIPDMTKTDFEYADVINLENGQYRCLDDSGKEVFIDINEAWYLGKLGILRNIKTAKCNNKRVIMITEASKLG